MQLYAAEAHSCYLDRRDDAAAAGALCRHRRRHALRARRKCWRLECSAVGAVSHRHGFEATRHEHGVEDMDGAGTRFDIGRNDVAVWHAGVQGLDACMPLVICWRWIDAKQLTDCAGGACSMMLEGLVRYAIYLHPP